MYKRFNEKLPNPATLAELAEERLHARYGDTPSEMECDAFVAECSEFMEGLAPYRDRVHRDVVVAINMLAMAKSIGFGSAIPLLTCAILGYAIWIEEGGIDTTDPATRLLLN